MERAEIKAGRPPKEEATALSDHVVAVADALFIENGYGATSMATVARRAQVGKQTLYRRFPDKAALFREVIRRRIDATVAPRAAVVVTSDPLGELKKMGQAALDTVLDPEFVRLYRAIIAEATLFPELAGATSGNWGSSFSDRCVEAIGQAQAMGVCRPGDPETMAQCFLWGLTGQAFLNGLTDPRRLWSEEARDAHLRAVWCVFLEGIISTRRAVSRAGANASTDFSNAIHTN
jgi:TetR/AcrR family transcriptional regulator, regulator of autoinduction and epiphytic fitness